MDRDRKYRMPGYQPGGGGPPPPADRPRPPGPAASPVLGSRTLSRCAGCGTALGPGTSATGSCPQCGGALHACRQCTHFDPARRFECSRPVPARIPDKAAANECPEFALRVVTERDTSMGAIRPEDAKRAFDRLFKKPSS